MDFEPKWSETASNEIEAIVRYFGRRDLKAAGRIGFGIFNHAQKLVDQPELRRVEMSLPNGE
ncbi:MAG: plasmid stabilization system protein ParE [Verrucomicrobiales bacterium]|jgi:plasmid stabilization system protein ParE